MQEFRKSPEAEKHISKHGAGRNIPLQSFCGWDVRFKVLYVAQINNDDVIL